MFVASFRMAKTYPKLAKILKKLLFDKEMKPIDLARKLNIPQPTIHRLVTGKSSRPYRSSLEPIANYFEISIDQLVGEEPFATEDASSAASNALANSHLNVKMIPILKWQNASNLSSTTTPSNPVTDETPTLVVAPDTHESAFSLIMHDTSMEPLFPRGTTLIFDPTHRPKDRSYVLIKLHEHKTPVFRQLLIDMDHQYLKPLNPDLSIFKMRLLGKKDKILASLVESRMTHLADHNPALLEEV